VASCVLGLRGTSEPLICCVRDCVLPALPASVLQEVRLAVALNVGCSSESPPPSLRIILKRRLGLQMAIGEVPK
jgi:hypothetical protein